MTEEAIADRGMELLRLLLTEPVGWDVLYFRPRSLGVCYPPFDFIVEVVDHPAYFFFAQVKATTKGYFKKEQRRLAQVDRKWATS